MPFGLRSQDHTWYVRRDLGLYTWDETFNLSGGRVENDWEAHATLFASPPSIVQAGGNRDMGGAFYYERRLGDDQNTAVAGQARVGLSGQHTRSLIGGIGKHYWDAANLLLMAELDLLLETFAESPGPSRMQMVTYAGASWFPIQGLMLTAAHERYDEDLSIKGTARDGLSLALQFFPWAKWELMLVGKTEFHGSADRNSQMGMLQLHYYL